MRRQVRRQTPPVGLLPGYATIWARTEHATAQRSHAARIRLLLLLWLRSVSIRRDESLRTEKNADVRREGQPRPSRRVVCWTTTMYLPGLCRPGVEHLALRHRYWSAIGSQPANGREGHGSARAINHISLYPRVGATVRRPRATETSRRTNRFRSHACDSSSSTKMPRFPYRSSKCTCVPDSPASGSPVNSTPRSLSVSYVR